MTYYLRGPMTSGSSVFMVAENASVLYFAIIATNAAGTVKQFVLDPRNPENPTVIAFSGSSKAVNMATSGVFLGSNSGNQLVLQAQGTPPYNFTFNQNQVANFGIALAGISYTITSSSTGNTIQIPAYVPDLVKGSIQNGFATDIQYDSNTPPQPVIQYLTVVRFVPQQWYFQGACNQYPTGNSAAIIEASWWSVGTSNQQGFTDVNDCNANVFYNYCPVSSYCATACKGPCQDVSLVCNYNSSNSVGFECGKAVVTKPFYKEWWFWVLVTIAIVILILIFVTLLRRSKS